MLKLDKNNHIKLTGYLVMINKYNKHYKENIFFGKPYPELINFFSKYSKDNFVLGLRSWSRKGQFGSWETWN